MAQKNFIESKNLDDDIGELSIFLLTESFENPIIQVDENEKIIAHKNIFKEYQTDIDSLKLKSFLKKISIENRPISITFNNSINQKLYYGNSDLFNKIKYFPFALVLVAVFFTLIVFNYFKSSFNSNKNKVWASFAKETAHQIGTPLSSLMGWSNILKEKDLDHQIIHEIDNDIMRLNKITKRFSEIGSKTKLKVENLNEILNTILVYLEKRNSSLIKFEFYQSNDDIKIKINKTLIEWVIENIVKNAIDSMSGNGKVQIKIIKENNQAKILISDNGSGMSNSQKNKIFDEGFTSKENGWGLGLSFSKRIMTVYHKGNIKVKNSTLSKGTTFELTFPIN